MPPAEGLGALARPSGAFAMVALDQRESLRTMLRPRFAGAVPDDALPGFKVDAARALSPHASAVLLDTETGLHAVLAAGALSPGTSLIVAADRLAQEPGGPVQSTDVDLDVLADDAVAELAAAYKLLVIWRADAGAAGVAARGATVRTFVEGCRRRGRPGIVEGIVRGPGDAPLEPGAHAELVLEAAAELGALGPDLYKAEVPTQGRADDEAIAAGARRLTAVLGCPWVVLSNGVAPERFADAAVAACRGGASGFLAGRAIWLSSIAADDPKHDLETAAAERLSSLAVRVDEVARPWWEA